MNARTRLEQAHRITTAFGRAVVNAWCVADDIYDRRRPRQAGPPSWRRVLRLPRRPLPSLTGITTATTPDPLTKVSIP